MAILIGAGSILWALVTPDPGDINLVLLLLWTLIAAHGLFMALVTLRRVTKERRRARAEGDPELTLIANGNVRRNALLALKLGSFLLIALIVLSGHANTTVSRALVLLILMLMAGGAALDADEIDEFDKLSNHRPLHLVEDSPKELDR